MLKMILKIYKFNINIMLTNVFNFNDKLSRSKTEGIYVFFRTLTSI